jgi:hypothetical protein
MNIFLPSFRFCGVLFGAMETSRMMAFTIIGGMFTLRVFVVTIGSLKKKAKRIVHQYAFLLHITIYRRIEIAASLMDKSGGQMLLVMMSASMVFTVCFAYCSVVLSSFIISMPFYFAFPVATFLIQTATMQILRYGIYCYEQSTAVLRLWEFAVLKASNRRYMIRKVKGMRPIRVRASTLDFNLYFLKRSTMGTVFNAVTTHTVNAVLLVPANNLQQLLLQVYS